MKRLVIFGTEAFAAISHYYFSTDSDYTVAGFTVDRAYMQEAEFHGLPVVPFEDVERRFPPDQFDMFVAVGIRQLNRFRAQKVHESERKGYRLANYVSSHAVTSPGLTLPGNCMVMELTLVHPWVRIGKNTIIWPSSQIAFYDDIGEHCWIVSATTGESVAIGDYTFVGLRSVIAPFVKIGRDNLIGAGAHVLSNTPDSAVFPSQATQMSKVPSSRAARLLV